MANLKNDPKVQELLAKATAAATKAENKRVVGLIKDVAATQVDHYKKVENKAGAKAAAEFSKAAVASVKAPF